MSNLPVPPVTMEDLQAFQAKHFPGSAPSLENNYPVEDNVDEQFADDEDGLGYYPDGVKRTLTDEQIEIFRHSEIHALLRERQLREEELAAASDEPAENKPADEESASQQKQAGPNADTEDRNQAKPKYGGGGSTATLDYDEGCSSSAKPQRPTRPGASQFAGRRLISYED